MVRETLARWRGDDGGMAVKLLLGNEVFEAPASRRAAKQEFAI